MRTVTELGPEHVSVYLLETAESGTESSLARAVTEGRVPESDESDLVAMYEAAIATLPRLKGKG